MQKILKLSFVAIAIIGIIAFANSTQNVAAQTTSETEITSQDLGVSNPSLLPDSRWYFIKSWKEKLQSTFTFGQVKKAELNLRLASERLLETRKLTEKANNPQILEKATELYSKQVEKINKNIDKFKDTATSSPVISKFLDKFVRLQILHTQILEKLELKVPTSTMEKIRQNRQAYLERFKQVMQKLEDKTQIQNRLQKAVDSIKNSLPATSTVKQKIDAIKDKLFNSTTTKNIVGGDKDEHGCIGSAGYSWCPSEEKCLRAWEETCKIEPPKGQRDVYGCWSPSGEHWCAAKNKCLKMEETCSTSTMGL